MNTRSMAAQATLHCLLGCIIGELAGLEIGRLMGFDTHVTIALAAVLSFVSGYTVSTIPLLRRGMTFPKALRLVLAADTLSILTMVIVDNIIMLLVPGAMDKDPLMLHYWTSRLLSFTIAFFVAWPVNYWQLKRGRGHALTHEHHGHSGHH
ncbi:MAG: DUF4396 domain-containing protein [Candidatus Saccharimonas sp.]